jgi:translation initiation factor IF-1
MKRFLLPAVLVILLPAAALAVECANGVVRAGCVGPNGAASVNKQTGATRSTGTRKVKCADGVYRTACAGPNGAVVIRR